MIPLVYLSYYPETPKKGYFDTALLERLFEGKVWNVINGYEFKEYDKLTDVKDDHVVIVIPARYHVKDIKRINAELERFTWCLIILANDEESLFPYLELNHPNKKVWVMTPQPGQHDKAGRLIGEGAPPDAYDLLPLLEKEAYQKSLDWMFSGQITHVRRKAMAKALEPLREHNNRFFYNETAGFTEGLIHEKYYHLMASAKVIPCPSGAVTPDSFRLFEALEAGAIPIADDISPSYNSEGYWKYVYPDAPFPILKDYDDLPGYIEDALREWPENVNHISAWWQQTKRQLAINLRDDIQELSGEKTQSNRLKDLITVIIPTSPIPSHPSTKIIEETIASIRVHLPTNEIFIMFDGVRDEQQDRKADYEEYKRRLLWKCNHEYSNVLPILFDEHMHQTGMTREILPKLETPLLLFVEADTPLTPDMPIDFDNISNAVMSGHADLVRLHFESFIPKEHLHMMHGAISLEGQWYMRTSQYSQRPHVSSVAYYRRILNDYFSPEAKMMIEDLMHGIVAESYVLDGLLGWQNHRLLIYYPEGNIKRSYHLDGRGSDSKFEETFIR